MVMRFFAEKVSEDPAGAFVQFGDYQLVEQQLTQANEQLAAAVREREIAVSERTVAENLAATREALLVQSAKDAAEHEATRLELAGALTDAEGKLRRIREAVDAIQAPAPREQIHDIVAEFIAKIDALPATARDL